MRVFIHKGSIGKLEELAKRGGGYLKIELMVIMKDYELVVPAPEERKYWVELKGLNNSS